MPRPATRWDSSELTDGTHHALVKPLSEGVRPIVLMGGKTFLLATT